jgi:hypothetical protein
MTYSAKRWLSVYFALLLGLAVFGSYNQQLYSMHRALISHKEELVLARTELSNASNQITGAQPVQRWAEQNGMVRVTHLTKAGTVKQGGAPRTQPASAGVEMYTLWQ